MERTDDAGVEEENIRFVEIIIDYYFRENIRHQDQLLGGRNP